MVKRYLSLCLINILYAANAYSQSDQCNCSENFESLRVATENNYAGFPAKVNSKTSAGYPKLLASVKHKVTTVPDPKKSFFLLPDQHPIDQAGFAPDKPLNNIPGNDWIELIKKNLEQGAR